MAYDELLRLTGPTVASGNTVGNAIEASPVAASGNGTMGWRFYGKYRTGTLDCRITGNFTSTGTFAFTISEASDGSGTGAAVIATSPALTATHRGNLSDQAATTATGGGKAAATLSDGPTRLGFATGSGGWVRAGFVTGGASPSAAGVAADLVPSGAAILTSGR